MNIALNVSFDYANILVALYYLLYIRRTCLFPVQNIFLEFSLFLGSFWLLSTAVTDLARLIGCVLVLKVIQTVLLFHSREHIKHWKESLPAPVVTDMLTSLATGICVSFPLALSLASAIDAVSR